MKKFCISLVLIGIIILTMTVGVNSSTDNSQYLRIHIRANSNSEYDQSVKMEIKSVVVNYLTPFVAECDDKAEAIKTLNEQKLNLQSVIDAELKNRGFDYSSNVKIANEKFPLRVYDDVTLQEGYYDAVIVELGKAEGDNWWCVVYPPLCFVGKECGIVYKSKIKRIISEFFENRSD